MSYLLQAPNPREILFLPPEHKIHIFSPPCKILCLFTTEAHKGHPFPSNLTTYFTKSLI